jgi:hypothetical protein
MTFDDFGASLSALEPPAGLSAVLAALWHDAKGDWERAHEIAQDVPDPDGAWVHAYLHRKEGDAGNAAYWYRRANRPIAKTTLQAEWEQIVRAFLDDPA